MKMIRLSSRKNKKKLIKRWSEFCKLTFHNYLRKEKEIVEYILGSDYRITGYKYKYKNIKI